MQLVLKSSWARPVIPTLIVLMTLLGMVPRVEAGFISSAQSAAARDQDMGRVQQVLENKIVQERLRAMGYSQEEINSRLEKLPNEDLHRLAAQIDTMRPAGDFGTVIAVLVIILLILLILQIIGKRVTVNG